MPPNWSAVSRRPFPTFTLTLPFIRFQVDVSWTNLDHQIEKFITHPNYHPPKQQYDIGLIMLRNRIELFTVDIHPACLWTEFNTSSLGKEALVTGWGVISEGD